MRGEKAVTGELFAEGGSGTRRAGIGEALAALITVIGDAVAERGRGIARAGSGDTARDLSCWKELGLRGVECVEVEASDGVLVRVNEGVRVFRERGRLSETLRSLSNGDAWKAYINGILDHRNSQHTWGSDLKLTE